MAIVRMDSTVFTNNWFMELTPAHRWAWISFILFGENMGEYGYEFDVRRYPLEIISSKTYTPIGDLKFVIESAERAGMLVETKGLYVISDGGPVSPYRMKR
jgi:hypothetical protein